MPNEDAQDFILDYTSVMRVNRTTGYDRTETGSRFNYGLKGEFIAGDGSSYVNAFAGQTYRLYDDPEIPAYSGLKQGRSDYVGVIEGNWSDWLAAGYQFRLDAAALRHNMSNVDVALGRPALKLNLSYLYIRGGSSLGFGLADREEIGGDITSRFSEHWSAGLTGRRDLAIGRAVYAGGFARYEDDCFRLTFNVRRDYTQDRDYDGGLSFGVNVELKTLGGLAPGGK